MTVRRAGLAFGRFYPQHMNGPYADHILDASDVCSNCFRRVRVERVDPVRGSLTRELDSHLERNERRTTIGYGPSEAVSESKGTFCECGVEGTHERLWDPTLVAGEHFRDLVKAAVTTLEEKDVGIKRKETIMYALSHWREHDDVDKALGMALEAGIVAAAAADDRREVSV